MKRSARVCIFAAVVLAWSQASFASTRGSGKRSFYVVSEDIQTLSEISLYLYGTVKYAPRIAKWNRLKRPYVIRSGQKLILKRPPTLTPNEGARQLLAMWRKRMGLEAANPSANAVPSAPPAPAPLILSTADLMSEDEEQPRVPDTPPPTSEAQAVPVVAEIPKAPPIPPETKKQFVALAKEAEKASADSIAIVDEIPTADSLFKAGEKDFKDGRAEDALAKFRRSRQMDAKPLPTWFFELRCLRMLKRTDEARDVAAQLVSEHPEVKPLPAVQQYLKSE